MSSALPSLTARQATGALLRLGFTLWRQKGSHQVYVKDACQVIVPVHAGTLKKGTLHQIIKGSGVSVEEFLRNI